MKRAEGRDDIFEFPSPPTRTNLKYLGIIIDKKLT